MEREQISASEVGDVARAQQSEEKYSILTISDSQNNLKNAIYSRETTLKVYPGSPFSLLFPANGL